VKDVSAIPNVSSKIKIRRAYITKSAFSHQDMNREAHLHGACGDNFYDEFMII